MSDEAHDPEVRLCGECADVGVALQRANRRHIMFTTRAEVGGGGNVAARCMVMPIEELATSQARRKEPGRAFATDLTISAWCCSQARRICWRRWKLCDLENRRRLALPTHQPGLCGVHRTALVMGEAMPQATCNPELRRSRRGTVAIVQGNEQ